MTMIGIPLMAQDRTLGFAKTFEEVDTDDPIEVPAGATGVVLWFVDADGMLIEGWFGIDESETPVETVAVPTMAPDPATWTQHPFRTRQYGGQTLNAGDFWVHAACAVPDATVKGYFLFLQG